MNDASNVSDALLADVAAGIAALASVVPLNITTGLAALAAALWYYAGLQTWRLMFIIDPDPENCELTHLLRAGRLPHSVFVLFIITWPAILLGVTLVDWLVNLQRGAND